MANTNNENLPGESKDKPTTNRTIGLFIAAGLFFVILFLILAYWGFSPKNTPMGNSGAQQPAGNSSSR